VPQIHLEADRFEQGSGLREITHDVGAAEHQRDVEAQQQQDDRGPFRRAPLLSAPHMHAGAPRGEFLDTVVLIGSGCLAHRRDDRRRFAGRQRLGRHIGVRVLGRRVGQIIRGVCRLFAEIIGGRRILFGLRRLARFGLGDHAGHESGDIDGRSAGKPRCLAARTTHHASVRPQRGRLDHVGRCTGRTDDQHAMAQVWRLNLAADR
jgi:hypothetical protein